MGPNLNLQTLRLTISDNFLNQEKISHIASFVRNSHTKSLYLENAALPLDGDKDEWSDFLDNLEPITGLPGLKYQIKWDAKTKQNM